MDDTDRTEYCGVGIRGVAMGIDSVVWVALLFAAILVTAALTGQLDSGAWSVSADLTGQPAWTAVGLWFALALGYHTVLEWLFGKTVGKYLVSIRVTGSDGSSPTLGASLLRNLVRLVDWLPGLYVVGIGGIVLSSRQQRLGDRLAGTTVVRR